MLTHSHAGTEEASSPGASAGVDWVPLVPLAAWTLVGLGEATGWSGLRDAMTYASATLVALILWARTVTARPARRVSWGLLAAHMSLVACGDVMFDVLQDRQSPQWIADVAYLSAYVPLIAALVVLLTLRRVDGLADIVIDATALTFLCGLALWQGVMATTRESATMWDALLTAAFPTLDMLVLGTVVALAFARGHRDGTVLLLMAYAVISLVGDLGSTVAAMFGSPDAFNGASYTVFDIAYGTLAAAAVYDMRRRTAPVAAPQDADGATSIPRLAILGLSLVGAPVLAILLVGVGGAVSVTLFVWATVAIGGLGVVRIIRLVQRLSVEKRRLAAAEAVLDHQANHDDLTGLPNRAMLGRRLQAMIAAAGADGCELALMFVDLDDFKQVNDTAGHAVGDQLLVTISQRLREEVGPGDVVARMGGDEFVVLTTGCADQAAVESLAGRIVAAVTQPVMLANQIVHSSASIGIAMLGPDDEASDLLRNADLALYRAKDDGRRRARMYDGELRRAALERTTIEDALRSAIDRGAITVHYQPRVELASGRLHSVEALVRWPERPDIDVQRFVAIAEETGLIAQIGDLVLSRACADLVGSADLGELSLAVNVSMGQLVQQDLRERVLLALGRSGLAADRLILEITETFLVDEPEWAARTLRDLRLSGVRVEIDDFGVGYSSFRRLSALPVDGVKVDRSFIDGLDRDPTAVPLVTAMAALGRAVGLQVTAEGIETALQHVHARRVGCDYGQGFLYCRPLPVDELVAVVRGWNPGRFGGVSGQDTSQIVAK